MLLGGGALSIHANVEQPPISIIEEDAVEEIMEFVSVDNMTGEVKYETLSYTPEVKIMTNGSIGNIHKGNADKYDDAAPNFAVRITLEIYTCLERIGEIGDISDEVYP